MTPEKRISQDMEPLRNYFLLFKTYYGNLLGWCIRTSLPAQDIPGNIASAARDWLLSPQGKNYFQGQEHGKQGFDFADALMKVPPEILAQQSIFLWTPIYEILELDPDEDLLPDEPRKQKKINLGEGRGSDGG